MTILPKSWSFRKIQQEFRASKYMVQTAKKLVTEKRILFSLRVKSSKMLTPATAEMVKQFYAYDEISRIMPGMRDYISVNSEEKESCFTIEKVETMLCRF